MSATYAAVEKQELNEKNCLTFVQFSNFIDSLALHGIASDQHHRSNENSTFWNLK